MNISDLVGLRINTVDGQSRKGIKIRFNGGTEVNVRTHYIRDSAGQDLDIQRLVGGLVTTASITNNVLQVSISSRLGQDLTLVTSGLYISDSRGSPVVAGDTAPAGYGFLRIGSPESSNLVRIGAPTDVNASRIAIPKGF